jgi:hypothetical protein
LSVELVRIPDRPIEESLQWARKTTPEKPPTKQEASLADKALRTGKAAPAQMRSMVGRIESERAAVKQAKKRWSNFLISGNKLRPLVDRSAKSAIAVWTFEHVNE